METDSTLPRDCEVLVAGGGFVGLALAVALGTAGIDVMVVDAGPPPAGGGNPAAGKTDIRTTALSRAVWRMLETLGIITPGIDAEPIRRIRVSDRDTPLFLDFGATGDDTAPFGHIIGNTVLREAMQARAQACMSLRMVRGRITGMQSLPLCTVLSVRTPDGGERHIRAALVAGTDGHNSTIRRLAGIGGSGWQYPRKAIVCTLACERPHQGVAHERFLDSGPFAVLPMTRNRVSLVWTERPELVPALLALPPGRFLEQVRWRLGHDPGGLALAGPPQAWSLSLFHAWRHAGRRLVLAGEAAHRMHPLAGQGLNAGLRDVAVLADLLAGQHRLGMDPGDPAMLARHQRLRRPDVIAMLAMTDGLDRLFAPGGGPVRLLRNLGLAAVNRSTALKRAITAHACGQTGHRPRLFRGLDP